MPIANEALANKKHVIVEKPLSNNISNIDKFYSNLKKTEQKQQLLFYTDLILKLISIEN